MSDTFPIHDQLIQALASGPPEGLRVAELRARIDRAPPPGEVQVALAALADRGAVLRDNNGRWALAATAVPAPTRPAPSHRTPLAGLLEVEDTGIPPRAPDGRFQLDPTQLAVVQAPKGARLVVEAGPGHGKTAVACARVAHLLDQGVPGTQILLLSFTRTAVREMRQRVAELAQAGTDVADLEIRTIDSWAWRVRSGYLSAATPTGSYEATIRQVLGLLREPTRDLADRLAGFEHVLIDEAQDLVGVRAQLMAALLRAVPTSCGFTVFLDPAQGIYDWAEDEAASGETTERFEELLATVPGVGPRVALGHLHRTADPELRRLLLGARRLVLDPDAERPASTLREILAARMAPRPRNLVPLVPRLPDDALVLFRRRGAALDASSWLAKEGIQHRLRLGGLPQPVAPWVAALLHDAYERAQRTPSLTRDVCEAAWDAMPEPYLTRGWTFERAWRVLRRMAAEGRSRINARRVADALTAGQVPDDLHTRELGPGGPILGTIHGSKGREGSHVVFSVPAIEDWRREDREPDESGEARVLYVAITRAKERLELYDGGRCYFGKANGRDWQIANNNRIRFEVGREGDLDAAWAMQSPTTPAGRHQRWMRAFDGSPRQVCALRREGRWATPWEIRDASGLDADGEGAMVISLIDKDVDRDLTESLDHKNRRRTSEELHFLYQLDITTQPLRPDHPALDRLPDPWRTLRLILAPVVVGLGSTFSKKR